MKYAYFDVIGMTGTVGVSVMSSFRLVFDVGYIYGDSSSFFFGSVIDFVICLLLCEIQIG